MEPVRINKYLSELGVCSRREADRLIEAGKVTVDGRPAQMGERVNGKETIVCDGRPVGRAAGEKSTKPVLLLVNKPQGIVCTTSDKDRAPNIIDLVQYPTRVYPVGRLDKDSEGLMLLTNQGELANRIIHAGQLHEKEYLVTLERPYDAAFLRRMREGVKLEALGVRTRPCRVETVGAKTFRITLTQGMNRQIRRMCGALGYRVVELRRVRIMNLSLGRLNVGDYRRATAGEMEELMRQLALSAEQSGYNNAGEDSRDMDDQWE